MMLLGAMLVTGCRPESFKDIGAPRTITSSFIGTWKITKVVQVDEDAKRKGSSFTFQSLDLTTLFPYTDFTLTLNANSSGQLTTFTVDAGNSPAIIGLTSGTWSVDNGDQPQALIFKQGSLTETVTLGAYPMGGNSKLNFRIERKDPANDNKVMISYTYEFTKQQ